MGEKIFNSRIIHKHAVEADWLDTIDFTPFKGEVIIYDPDTTHDCARIKIGDGKTNINDLDFVVDHVIVDEQLSNISTNPVQNKVVADAISDLNVLIGDTSVSEQIEAAVSDKVTKTELSEVIDGASATVTSTVVTPTDVTKYYLLASDKADEETDYARKTPNINVNVKIGTANTVGISQLILGNKIATGNDGNSVGYITMYSEGGGSHRIYPPSLASSTGTAIHDLPRSGGILLNYSMLVAGDNVTLSQNESTGKVTISSKDTVYTHPTTEGSKHIPVGGSTGQILRWSAAGTAEWGDEHGSSYDNATQTAAGLMSADDKKKLDGIAAGANKITVDTALSATSTNPVQNKVVKGAIDELYNCVRPDISYYIPKFDYNSDTQTLYITGYNQWDGGE